MTQSVKKQNAIQTELICAALRYCAVADWFEGHPSTWQKNMSDEQAMAVFNQAEQELRKAGAQALRQHGHRKMVLQGMGLPEEVL